MGRVGHGRSHAGALGPLAGLIAAALVGLAAGCAGESAPPIPAFAERLPGRTALVLWGASPPPAELVGAAALLAEHLGLVREPVDAPGEQVLAYSAPPAVAVGWPDLASSRNFQRALVWSVAAEEIDEEIPQRRGQTHLYLDLQLLVESIGLRMPDRFSARERVFRALALRSLEFVIARVGPGEEPDSWSARGDLSVTSARTGLTGLLTTPTATTTHAPVRSRGAWLQLDVHSAPGIARRSLEVLFSETGGPTMFGDLLAGPTRGLLDLVGRFAGRASVTVYPGGLLQAAARFDDPVAAAGELEELVRFGGNPAGDLIAIETHRDDWVSLRAPLVPRWAPPESAAATSGPFVRASAKLGPTSPIEGVLTLDLRPSGLPGKMAIELDLLPE